MPTAVELYDKLRPKLGDEEAKTLVEYISVSVERHAATKEDIERARGVLKEDIGKVRSELKEDIERVKSELEINLERIRGELDVKIEKTKSDIIKWMFLFWIGQLASLIAILKIFLG
jgi:uncharacterized FlaG/YvyC family protein